ncbi:hypothetical protein Tco_0254879 [Tanacetum coccineum]
MVNVIFEIGKSSRIDDEVVQDQRQRDDNDLHDKRQDQPKKEEVEPRRSKRARTMKSLYETPRANLYEHNETPGGSIYWEPHIEGILIPVEGTYFDTLDKAIDMYTSVTTELASIITEWIPSGEGLTDYTKNKLVQDPQGKENEEGDTIIDV